MPRLDALTAGMQAVETIVRHDHSKGFALIDAQRPAQSNIGQLFRPLIHRERTIDRRSLPGIRDHKDDHADLYFRDLDAGVAGHDLVRRPAVFFEAIRKTNMWMTGCQQIERMGRYCWNTPTLLSRGSSQCSRIFDFDTDLNPLPFEAFRHGGRIWVVEENKMRGTTFTCALPPRQSAQMSGSC
jgi:hypothetical protein